jgi:hypothetical protein
MARNRRNRREPNKIVVHITARVFEALPFVPGHCQRLSSNLSLDEDFAASAKLAGLNYPQLFRGLCCWDANTVVSGCGRGVLQRGKELKGPF